MGVGGWAGAVPILRATVNFGENAYMLCRLRSDRTLIFLPICLSVRAFLPTIGSGEDYNTLNRACDPHA